MSTDQACRDARCPMPDARRPGEVQQPRSKPAALPNTMVYRHVRHPMPLTLSWWLLSVSQCALAHPIPLPFPSLLRQLTITAAFQMSQNESENRPERLQSRGIASVQRLSLVRTTLGLHGTAGLLKKTPRETPVQVFLCYVDRGSLYKAEKTKSWNCTLANARAFQIGPTSGRGGLLRYSSRRSQCCPRKGANSCAGSSC